MWEKSVQYLKKMGTLILFASIIIWALGYFPMAKDENVMYFLNDEMNEFNFQSITDETAFYLNAEGEIVISFNEGDVAPMYMGVVTFTIPEAAIEGIRK